jgi:hypothetical protein
MSSHDQSMPSMTNAVEAEVRPALVEQAVAIGFLATVSVTTFGWLYVLATAAWNSISWLFS